MLDFDTHGLDWKERVRESTVFVCYATRNWQRNRFNQRQLAYARQLGKSIYFLVPTGARVAALPGERVYVVETMEDAALVLQEIEAGDR